MVLRGARSDRRPARSRLPCYPRPPVVAAATAITVSGGRYGTGTTVDAPDEARARAEIAQDRLERHAKGGGFLVLLSARRSSSAPSPPSATWVPRHAASTRRHRGAPPPRRRQGHQLGQGHPRRRHRGSRRGALGPAAHRGPRRPRPCPGRAAPRPDHILLTHPGPLGPLRRPRPPRRAPRAHHPPARARPDPADLVGARPRRRSRRAPHRPGQGRPRHLLGRALRASHAWLRNLHRTHPSPVPGGST